VVLVRLKYRTESDSGDAAFEETIEQAAGVAPAVNLSEPRGPFKRLRAHSTGKVCLEDTSKEVVILGRGQGYMVGLEDVDVVAKK
jgi:hypothetical protein